MAEILISTSSRELRDEILNAKFDGTEQYEPLRKCIEIEKLFHVVIEHLDSLGTGLLGAWLYDAIKKHRPNKTKIQGRDAPESEVEIRRAIEEIVQAAKDDDPGEG